MKSKSVQARLKARVFDIHDWTCVDERQDSIAYRPSGRTLLRRIGYLLLAVCAIGLLASVLMPILTPNSGRPLDTEIMETMLRDAEALKATLRESVSTEEWERIEAEAAGMRAEREAMAAEFNARRALIENVVTGIAAGIAALLAFAGIMSPLTCLWRRVSIAQIGSNMITIHSRGVWSSTLQVSTHDFPRLAVRAQERIHSHRNSGVMRLGHRWIVSLDPDMQVLVDTAEGNRIEFWIQHQKDRPVPEMPLPARVRQLTGALERMTGATAEPLVLMDYQGKRGPWFNRRHVVAGTSTAPWIAGTMIGEPQVTSKTWTLDEMTPEMRARFEP
ncbi:MAG: hypothetical protein SGI88_01460, partial [Candidatus Hydrogenedentes bacterium]|nr:hypothetical protein [Candidatus Hydrogenedentota bacterium]